MNNIELKARIVEVNLGIIDINDFKYGLHKMQVGNLDSFKVLLPIYNDVFVGDCIVTTNWKLTRIGTETNPVDLCVRVDAYDIASPDGFDVTKYLNTKVTGLFLSSEKCVLRTIGPDKKPFYMATIKIKDSFDISFDLILVAFSNQAKKLSTVKRASVIDCECTVKKRKNCEGYELAVLSFTNKSEV